MERNRQLLLTTMLYALILVLVTWFFNYGAREFLLATLEHDPGVFFIPVTILTCFLYAASVAQQFLRGKMAEPICRGLRRLGVVLSVGLLLALADSSGSIQLSNALFIGGSIIFIILSYISETYGVSRFWVGNVTTALKSLTVGISASFILFFMPEMESSNLRIFIIFSSSIIALTAILGTLRQHPNTHLVYVGRKINSKFRIISSIVIVGAYYYIIVRVPLTLIMGRSATLLTLLECAAVCVFSIIVYKERESSLAFSSSAKKGSWEKHTQSIEYLSDHSQERWSRIINEFIRNGENELLYIYLTELLRKMNVSNEIIKTTLTRLFEYTEPDEDTLWFARNRERRAESYKGERRQIVSKILDQVKKGTS